MRQELAAAGRHHERVAKAYRELYGAVTLAESRPAAAALVCDRRDNLISLLAEEEETLPDSQIKYLARFEQAG